MSTVSPKVSNDEGAAMCGYTPASFKFLRFKGRGPRFIKTGPAKQAKVLYDVADIEAWLEQRKFNSTTEHSEAVRTAEAAAKGQPIPSAPIIAPWLKQNA